jgi:hypothetical protein
MRMMIMMMVFKNWRKMLFTISMVCLITSQPTRTVCVENDSSRIEQVWEVIEPDTIKVTMILKLKLNLPFHLFLGNMMLRNTWIAR